MTAHELKDRFCLHDSSLISVTRSADLPGVFNGVLLKPITPDVLRKVIHGVLQNK